MQQVNGCFSYSYVCHLWCFCKDTWNIKKKTCFYQNIWEHIKHIWDLMKHQTKWRLGGRFFLFFLQLSIITMRTISEQNYYFEQNWQILMMCAKTKNHYVFSRLCCEWLKSITDLNTDDVCLNKVNTEMDDCAVLLLFTWCWSGCITPMVEGSSSA